MGRWPAVNPPDRKDTSPSGLIVHSTLRYESALVIPVGGVVGVV